MRVGADIENICTKCGDVAHVIVALDKGKIVKVECKECGSRHRNRLPEHLKAAAKKSTGGATRPRRSKTPAGPAVEPDLNRPVRRYRPSDSYEIGDRVDHVQFGTGVVEKIHGSNKVQVFFATGPKKLVQGRPSSAG